MLGWALRAHGANDRAVPVHREASGWPCDGDVNAQVWNYQGLGVALTGLGRYDEADEAMRRGLDAAATMGSATSIRLLSEADGWVSLMRGDWRSAAEDAGIGADAARRGTDGDAPDPLVACLPAPGPAG